MSKVKKAVLTVVATLALALIIGATSDGLEFGRDNEQASGSIPLEQMKLAGDNESSNGGG